MNTYIISDKLITPLLTWYQQNKKPLPWRLDPTPYHVWISEIMLQQTRIEAVIPYYARFLAVAPTIEALASLPEDKLLKLWEGLGYYSRVRNLQKCAIQLVERYGGELPSSAEELEKLPGIGAYTAGAISSIAYGRPAPAVDGNVLRVISRLYCIGDDIMSPATRKGVTAALAAIYPTGAPAGELTQAVMELGETVCIPNGQPLCSSCPLASHCHAHGCGTECQYPIRTEKKARRIEQRTVLLLNCNGKYAIARRPKTGLLASMPELPNVEHYLSEDDVYHSCTELCLSPESVSFLGKSIHIFTHLEWHMVGYAVSCRCRSDTYEWYSAEEIKEIIALPTAFKYYAKQIR